MPTPNSQSLIPGLHTDIPSGDWIDRRLPPSLRPYARLMRLDRPIGTWLLLWPCLWSVALASLSGWPNIWFMLLFSVGAVVMRGAGCVINDIYDRDIDGKVERTSLRPLVSGQVSLQQALILLIFLLLIGLVILLQFNALTFWFGVSSLILVFTYPLAKRVTWWPQLVLGLTFNWGALMGWTAMRDTLGLPALLLYVGGIFWTLGYDTIYAHQDKRDDALIGIKSLALRLGDQSPFWIAGFYTACVSFLTWAGMAVGMGPVFYVFMFLAALHACWQLGTWDRDAPANCLRRFRSNRDFGLIVFMGFLLGWVL